MGVMTFTLPPDLPLEDTHELEKASVTGGPDGMPFFCQVQVEPTQLTITRELDESGTLSVPWRVKKSGQLMVNSASLIERKVPYSLQLELARGKVNQLRNQCSDWLLNGLNMPQALTQRIKDATLAFCRAVARHPSEDSRQQAENALILGCEAADELVRVYTNQVFQVRKQRQQRLDTILGCRVGPTVPTGDAASAFLKSFNGLNIPFSIHEIAATEGDYEWEAHDKMVEWARQQSVALWGGPLVDFSPAKIPSWLWLWQRDRGRLARVLCDYTTEVIGRYHTHVRTWELTMAGNVPGVLSLQDDELLWLTLQMAEAARKVAPDIELIVGVSQPWGDYMAGTERTYSPFVYVDTLLRSNIQLAAIDLEIVMGVHPRGSYCRDLLDMSRMLDLYALLGVPLQVTLGYPAESPEDAGADSGYATTAGHWRETLDPQTQSDWANEMATLALCKPYVRAVQWVQYSDAVPHAFPHCGLLDAQHKPRPALLRLQKLRTTHLR